MQLGIFAKTFPGTDPAAVLAAAARRRLRDDAVQPRLLRPPRHARRVPAAAIGRVRAAAAATGVALAALSGTYNMAHPDPAVRADGRPAGSRAIAAAAAALAIPLVTALHRHAAIPRTSGAHHPDNADPPPGPTWLAEIAPGAGRSPSATASISASSPSWPTS